MNSMEILVDPTAFATCAISAHLFFASIASAVILLVWNLRVTNPYPRWNFDAWAGEIFQEFFIAFC